MLRAENLQNEKIINALEELGLDSGELEAARKYLGGEAGEEVLAGISFRDMMQMPPEKPQALEKLLMSCYKKKRYEEVTQLFNLMYAVGGSTCIACFSYVYNFTSVACNDQVKLDPVKMLAVHIQDLDKRYHYPLTYTLKMAVDTYAKSDRRIVLQAYHEYKGQNGNGRLVLLTLYFYLRCGAAEPAAEILEDEDKALLKDYEDRLVGNLRRIFESNAIGEQQIKELQKHIMDGTLTSDQLRGIRGRAVNENLFQLLGGCAYINYMLSEKLHSIVRVCSAADPGQMLKTIEEMDLRRELERSGEELEELFGIPGREIIVWAAKRHKKGFNVLGIVSIHTVDRILKTQLRRHTTEFIEEYKKAEYSIASGMAEIIKECDPALYQKEVMQSGRDVQMDKVIDMLVIKGNLSQQCRDYLAGRSDLSAIYAIRDQFTPYYGAANGKKALMNYVRTYQDEAFYSRCMALMAVRRMEFFFAVELPFDKKDELQKELQHMFRGMTLAGVELEDQLQVVCRMVDDEYWEEKKKSITQGCIPVFQQYLAERTQETENAFAGAGAYGRYFALLVYGSEAGLQITEENQEACEAAVAEYAKGKDAWKEQILSYTQDSSKQVKQELEKLLADRPGWREQVTALLSSKKAAERELGIRVLSKWNTPQDKAALQELYAKEKNAKIRALLDTALGHDPAEGGDGTGSSVQVLTLEDKVKELHKGGKKRSLAWAYETPFSPVHRKSGELATEEYLQALLLCYSSMGKPGINKDAALLAEDLESQELAVYMGELFDKWMEAGAEAKKRWVLFAASIHGGSDIIQQLHHQIQEWPQNARGAIASDAVQALALNPQPQALLIVDGIARKFKFKQVKAAAGQALEFAASQLGLTREQLEDKIVPNLGFDDHMERRFDYGSRSFTVTITPALEVEIFDENGKKLKNIPAPGAKDDAEKAAAAYAEFKEMKKQMKATVSSQKQRLEMALSTERLWTVCAWQELFVINPIMHQFAIGLVWGIYEEHKLVQSFRYMEDGSFNTEDEEEYTLPEQGEIGLVHPIELTKESLETWKQQLEDYEITQPIEQLNRTVYYLTQEEQESKSLERFGGMLINDLSLGGKLTALGWYRGSVQDAGCFDTYYREDASLGLGAELHFSGSFVGSGGMGGEEVTVYDVRFYKAGAIERGSYCYDEAKGEKQIPLKDIPQRYFSEIVWQLTKATASSKERDEDWKAEMR